MLNTHSVMPDGGSYELHCKHLSVVYAETRNKITYANQPYVIASSMAAINDHFHYLLICYVISQLMD